MSEPLDFRMLGERMHPDPPGAYAFSTKIGVNHLLYETSRVLPKLMRTL